MDFYKEAEKFLIKSGCQRMDCDGEVCNFFEDVQPKDLVKFAEYYYLYKLEHESTNTDYTDEKQRIKDHENRERL